MANKTFGPNRKGGRLKEKFFNRGDLSEARLTEAMLASGCFRIVPGKLADMTGVHVQQVQNWLRGEKVTARVDAVLREALALPDNPASSPEAPPPFRAKHYSEYVDAQAKEIGARPRKRGPYKKRSAA